MKSIETSYNGHKFRSRLEARTAVLMDGLKIPYVYEPEGFVFDDGTTYLPDFYLPNQGSFLECKGVMDEKDLHKIEMLAKESGKYVAIMYPDLHFTLGEWTFDQWEKKFKFVENDSWICKCNKCGKVYFGDANGLWDCKCCGYYDGEGGFEVLCYEFEYELNNPCDAMIKAKKARFEFGEVGK